MYYNVERVFTAMIKSRLLIDFRFYKAMDFKYFWKNMVSEELCVLLLKMNFILQFL